jgi:hypothetical protein
VSTRTRPDDASPAQRTPEGRAQPPPSRTWSPLKVVAAIGAVLAAVVLVGLAGLVLVAQLIPTLPNPFATESVDRSGPAVLQALEDLSEYRAATGRFQVILDVEENARYLPSALRGERVLFVAVGTVDAAVDFSGLGDDAVDVADDRTRVSVRLPSPHLSQARVDPAQSYVFERQRGLLDRLGSVFSDNPTGERELYLLAQERLMAAAEETDLTTVAERNTRLMLGSLLRSLGFTDVRIAFD